VGETYELGGDTGYTLADIAATFAAVSGKPVVYKDLPEADYAKMLEGFGLPGVLAQALANSDTGIRDGVLRDTSGDLVRLIGRKTTPLADSVRAALA
jgi:NAD(P)H dehydrogenase (quinone)